jgi:hypothetical protein
MFWIRQLSIRDLRRLQKMKTVVGLYDDLEDAREAVDELVEAGIPRSDISLVARDVTGEYGTYLDEYDEAEDVGEAAAGGAVGGAVVGGLMGLLVGLGAFAIPGLGPIIAAGPLAAALAGAGIGAATGGILGALVEWGIPEAEAGYYAEGVRRGSTLLAVRVPENLTEDVVEIMNDYAPVNIERRAEYWRNEYGWQGYDPNAEPFGAEEIESYRSTLSDWDDADDYDYDDDVDIDLGEEILDDNFDVTDADFEDETRLGTRRNRSTPVRTYGGATGTNGGSVQGHVKPSVSDTSLNYDKSNLRWEDLESGYRSNYDTMYAATGTYTWSQYAPAYRYGYNLATDPRYAGSSWTDVEVDARSRWEMENDGAWEEFKDAVRYGWEQVKDALGAGGYDTGVDDRSDEHMHRR